jgi:hypothetical protein
MISNHSSNDRCIEHRTMLRAPSAHLHIPGRSLPLAAAFQLIFYRLHTKDIQISAGYLNPQ